MDSILGVAAAATGIWVLQRLISLRKARKSLGDCPGGEVLFLHPFRTLSLVLGPWYPFPDNMGSYFEKFDIYQKYGSTCLSSIVFNGAIPTYWLSDAEAIKVVNTDRATFQKDVVAYETLNIYGPNLVGTEGSEWRRHRRIANPAFNEANNAFVWSETIRFVNEWFQELDEQEKITSESTHRINILESLTQLTLLVISSAGFSRRVSWTEDSLAKPPPGHTMAFRPAVTSAIHNTIVKILTPDFLYALSAKVPIPFITPLLRETRESFEALRMHMLEVVSSARARAVTGSKGNESGEVKDAALLRNLVAANMAEGADYKGLTDDELLSDTFTFLLAGHETSAHTVSYAMSLLALYPDVQRKVFEEASKLWPNGVPESSDPSTQCPTSNIRPQPLHETLRLFPSIARLGKPVCADTTLKAKRFSSKGRSDVSDVEEFVVPIAKGSIVIVDIFGLHHNPMYWGSDPLEFRPERFVDTETYRWPRDAFLAFSSGARSCIGQRFATTESTCIIASLVRKYEILPPEDIRELSFEDQKRIMLKSIPGITLTPTYAKVVFKRRL
ncbi:hypothetical protein ONZ45_g14909 [Pleurotus djamor]|nr:hypothetical protein ONZ45_g14909 [Pleurotus djamor]